MSDEIRTVPTSPGLRKSPRRAGKRKRQSPVVYLPTVLFGLAVFGGMLFIFSAKTSGYSNYVTIGVPVSIMLGYAALLGIITAFKLHVEQASDNFYYMGFLFTLTSLGVALYQFNDAQQVSDIVRNFGIAIATTIVGIALRIIWIQMRRDPIEIEHESRIHLAAASQQLTAELASAAREFSQFRSANLQMIQEGFAEVDGLAKNAADDTKKALDELAVAAKLPLELLSQDLKETLTEISKTFKEQTDEKREFLSESNAELSKGVEDLRKHLKVLEMALANFKTPDAAVKIEMQDALLSFSGMIEGHDRRSQQLVEGLKENSADMRALAEELKGVPGQITTAADSLHKTLSELTAIASEGANRKRPSIVAPKLSGRRWFPGRHWFSGGR